MHPHARRPGYVPTTLLQLRRLLSVHIGKKGTAHRSPGHRMDNSEEIIEEHAPL